MAAMMSSASPGSTGRSASAASGGSVACTTICSEATRNAVTECRAGRDRSAFWRVDIHGVSRAHQLSNLTGVLLPFAGVIVAVGLLWGTLVHWSALAVMAVMYLLTCLGVTLGFHRLLTHRSFQTHRWFQYGVAAVGSMSVQGPVMSWVADHRKHHAHTDQEGEDRKSTRLNSSHMSI